MEHYIFNHDHRIWARVGATSLSYSDGDKAEDYLLTVLRNANDVSTSSLELRSAICDWPSEYHLSMMRHNLLRPFQIKDSDQILELGCGCGSISRHLGETGASVYAVEGSYRRAQIAAERCRDLINVKIFCDNINEFIPDIKFDFVTLIGVLEYARMFIASEDPVKTCLEKARSFLKDDGVLILAIENQLGLKYFNGCAEDHTGIPYFGINNCYGKYSPVTFTRKELIRQLSASGFETVSFYYPLPDYKLPRLIIATEALDHPRFNVEDFLCMTESLDYTGNSYRGFHETRVWPLLARDGLFPDLANSFLILASKKTNAQIEKRKAPWLAASYSTDRLPAYATETLIVQTSEDRLEVTKKAVFLNAILPQEKVQRFIHHLDNNCPYLEGKLLLAEFQSQMAAQADVLDVIKPWVAFLRQQSSDPHNSMGTIPGHFLDCIPRNLVTSRENKLSFFDSEWIVKQPIPLLWVVVRGMVDSISKSKAPECLKGKIMRDFITGLFNSCEIEIRESDWLLVDQMEAELQQHVFGHSHYFSYIEFLNLIVGKEMSIYERIFDLEAEITRSEAEIKRVKATVSWWITKPLRLMSLPVLYLIKWFRKHHKDQQI